jgi:hypothetical protein
MEAHADPADSVVYIGLEWSEMHRVDGIRRGWAPYHVVFPMMDPPYRDKEWMLRLAFTKGIVPPRLYAMGFQHNNCGGACVKAGQASWAHLLKMFPDRYLVAEAHEEAFRAKRGDYSILTEQRGGVKYRLTLRELRRRIEAANAVGEQGELFDAYDALDWGGCGCMNEFES